MEYIVYTYDPATKACHAYGPIASETAAEADAGEIRTANPTFSVMVLPLETPPGA